MVQEPGKPKSVAQASSDEGFSMLQSTVNAEGRMASELPHALEVTKPVL